MVYQHPLFAHGLRRLLEREGAFCIVGMMEQPMTSPGRLRRCRPDVVIIEGDADLTILEDLVGVVGVRVSLKGAEATIFTEPPIQVSGPQELIEALKIIARKRGGP